MQVKVQQKSVNKIKFSNRRPYIFYTSGKEGTVKLWDARKFTEPIYTFNEHESGLSNVQSDFLCDDKYLVTGSSKNLVCFSSDPRFSFTTLIMEIWFQYMKLLRIWFLWSAHSTNRIRWLLLIRLFSQITSIL